MAIEYATLFHKSVVDTLSETPLTSILDSQTIKVSGGKEVKIPDLDTGNLIDYDRDGGYKKTAASITWIPYTLQYDRDASFRIDRMDEDETGFVMNANLVLKTKNQEVIAPEIDCMRISKLVSKAKEKENYKAIAKRLDKTNVVEETMDLLARLRDRTAVGDKLVLFMDNFTHVSLKQATTTASNTALGENTFDGVQIIILPTNRMKSAYTIDNTGCNPAVDAKQAYVVGVCLSAVHGITKVSDFKVVFPEQNQAADAWDVNGRIYHDLFILKQYEDRIEVIGEV